MLQELSSHRQHHHHQPPTPTHQRLAQLPSTGSTGSTHLTWHSLVFTFRPQPETNLRWGGIRLEIWCNIKPLIPGLRAPELQNISHYYMRDMTLESGCFTHESDLGCVCCTMLTNLYTKNTSEPRGTNNNDLHQKIFLVDYICGMEGVVLRHRNSGTFIWSQPVNIFFYFISIY